MTGGKFEKRGGEIIYVPKFNQRLIRHLNHLARDAGYRFKKRDITLANLCNLVTNSGLTVHQISQLTAKGDGDMVAPATIARWLDGTVNNPRNSTMEAVFKALGYERPIIASAQKVVVKVAA